MNAGDRTPVSRMLTLQQVAKALQVSERTVQRLVQEGAIPGAKKVGSRWRFSPSKIEEFVNGS